MNNLFTNIHGSPLMILYGCLFAYAFGVVHTFLPGHGKTIISGYFVGRKRDFGVLAITSSHILVKNIILPKIQLISAALLNIFGSGILISGILKNKKHHQHKHLYNEHFDEHTHTHQHENAHFHNEHTHEHGTEHHYDKNTYHHLHHKMDEFYEYYLSTDHLPFHSYLHLLWLSLAAGIIPCLEPFTIILLAISLNKIVLGLLLLLFFGLGVYTTMITLGIILTSEKLTRQSVFDNIFVKLLQNLAMIFKFVYPIIIVLFGTWRIYAVVVKL